MAKFLLKVCYSAEGVKGVMKEGASTRVAFIDQLVQGIGGKVESFYFAFGGVDVYVIVDLPDNATAIALATTVGSSSAISSYDTVVLLTPAEVDAAAKITVAYRPPGA
jgi:uncharacterized protein with GYD domain